MIQQPAKTNGAPKAPSAPGAGRLVVTKREACELLGGVSMDTLERYVMKDVSVIRRGRVRLIPVYELQRWIKENASKTLERS